MFLGARRRQDNDILHVEIDAGRLARVDDENHANAFPRQARRPGTESARRDATAAAAAVVSAESPLTAAFAAMTGERADNAAAKRGQLSHLIHVEPNVGRRRIPVDAVPAIDFAEQRTLLFRPKGVLVFGVLIGPLEIMTRGLIFDTPNDST